MRGVDPFDRLFTLGLDHRTTSGTARGLLLRDRERLDGLLADAHADGRLEGAVVVATCLRFEVVLVAPDPELLVTIADWMRARAPISAPTLRSGTGAALHVLRVAGSLESLVPGEREVARQVRKAFDVARASGLVERTLNALDRHATLAARRLHDEVFTDERTRGFASEAIARVLESGATRVLVLGQGELGTAVARGLSDHCSVTVGSRHPKVIAGVSELLPLGEALARIDGFEAIVVATAASSPVLSGAHLTAGAPLVIDLGTPPQVADDFEIHTQVIRLGGLARGTDDDTLVRAQGIVAEELVALERRLGRQSASAASKASTVFSSSDFVWAVERNETSNPLGAR